MTSEEEFYDTLERIESFISNIGDEISEDILDLKDDIREEDGMKILPIHGNISIEIPSEGVLGGFVCQHGTNIYLVIASQSEEFLEISYPFDLVSHIGSVLSDDQALQMIDQETLPEVEEEEDEIPEYKMEAARNFLASIEDEHMDQLQFYLGDRLSNPNVAFRMLTSGEVDDREYLRGFMVSKKVFPYTGDFGIADYNDAVQAVVSVGFNGLRYLSNAFIFDLEEDESPKTVSDKIEFYSG